MDELTALMMIFKQNMEIADGTIRIRNNTRVYEIDRRTMRVAGGSRADAAHANIFEHIYRDSKDTAVRTRSMTAGLEAVGLDTQRMTEEQFRGWQSSRLRAAAEPETGLSGKGLWLGRRRGDGRREEDEYEEDEEEMKQ